GRGRPLGSQPGESAPGPVPRARRRLRLLSIEFLDVADSRRRLDANLHVISGRFLLPTAEVSRDLRFPISDSLVAPPHPLGRISGLIVGVLVIAADEGKRGRDGPMLAGLVHGPRGGDPIHGSDLVLVARQCPDGRVVRPDAGLVLIDVLLRKIECEKRAFPEHAQVDGTVLRAAACERALWKEREHSKHGNDAPTHGVCPPRQSYDSRSERSAVIRWSFGKRCRARRAEEDRWASAYGSKGRSRGAGTERRARNRQARRTKARACPGPVRLGSCGGSRRRRRRRRVAVGSSGR